MRFRIKIECIASSSSFLRKYVPRRLRQPAIGAALVGMAFAIIGIWIASRTIAFHSRSREVVAEIVGTESEVDEQQKTRTYPVVEYTDVEGRPHRHRMDVSSSSWTPGNTLKVRYDPADPDHPRSGGILEWLFPAGFIVFGTLFAGIGIREVATMRTENQP